jgi:hypothetical protein
MTLLARINTGNPVTWNMDREAVQKEVRRVISSLPGIEAVEFLDSELCNQIKEIETKAEANGACGGLMPFTNKGVWAALSREVTFVIILHSKTQLFDANAAQVLIEDQKGQVVGEWLSEKRLKELQGKENMCFIAKDFVLYTDVHSTGEPRFILPESPFHYIDNVPGVTNAVSGSISTMADDFVRKRLGFSGPNRFTHLIGYDLKKGS